MGRSSRRRARKKGKRICGLERRDPNRTRWESDQIKRILGLMESDPSRAQWEANQVYLILAKEIWRSARNFHKCSWDIINRGKLLGIEKDLANEASKAIEISLMRPHPSRKKGLFLFPPDSTDNF